MGDLGEFAGQICESIGKNTGYIAAVCDRDAIIAVHGVQKRELLDKRCSQELEQLMELAAKQEKNLNNEQILEIFGLNQLSPQQLQSLYEYLRIQGIRIQGADLAPMDIGKALDPQEEQEEEKKPVILEAEDEQCLKEYEEMLRQFPSEKEGEREALLLQAVTDVAGVQERLAQLYLKEILQYARKLWRQGIYIGDLIQEGNMSLLLALAEEMPEEGKAGWMEQRLLAGMESWVKEQTEQKYRDESMVEKVRKLEAAIRELSDDEEQKFSVEELAAYLDMDEEEIRAVLRLTSEGADEEK